MLDDSLVVREGREDGLETEQIIEITSATPTYILRTYLLSTIHTHLCTYSCPPATPTYLHSHATPTHLSTDHTHSSHIPPTYLPPCHTHSSHNPPTYVRISLPRPLFTRPTYLSPWHTHLSTCPTHLRTPAHLLIDSLYCLLVFW